MEDVPKTVYMPAQGEILISLDTCIRIYHIYCTLPHVVVDYLLSCEVDDQFENSYIMTLSE